MTLYYRIAVIFFISFAIVALSPLLSSISGDGLAFAASGNKIITWLQEWKKVLRTCLDVVLSIVFFGIIIFALFGVIDWKQKLIWWLLLVSLFGAADTIYRAVKALFAG